MYKTKLLLITHALINLTIDGKVNCHYLIPQYVTLSPGPLPKH